MTQLFEQTWQVQLAGDRLARLTKHIEETVGDGTPFFDTMDETLQETYWLQVQYLRYLDSQYANLNLVVSGKWGEMLEKYLMPRSPRYVLKVRGGLRHGELPPLDVDLTAQRFLFLDDSCYKGRTRDKIAQRIQEAGGELVYSYVLYDGSIDPIPGIEGVFRYHGGATA